MGSTKLYCAGCGLEIMEYEDMCERCGGVNFAYQTVPAPIDMDKKALRHYNIQLFDGANGYIDSGYKCLCGGDHRMIYPGIRDEDDYSLIHPMTFLPRCPIDVWNHAGASGMGMALSDLLKYLEV